MRRAILLMGPTASGKTALALALAERADGEIVNADAMQVYRDLRVLSARPAPQDEARAPHHLFGHVDAGERYSAARWLADALACIEDIAARGRTPIVVGGTGLYFKALTEGLADAPEAPAVRARLAAQLAADGPQTLYAALARVDPEAAAALGPRDGARILRALEVWETTGVSILKAREATKPALPAEAWIGAALRPERGAIYAAISARFAAMLQAGALEEARAMMARGLDPAAPAMKAIGLGPLIAHLRGELSLERAREKAERDTRRYAKRQYTWIAGQMRRWPRIEHPDLENRLEDIFALMRGVDPAFAAT